jgi:hypothetical protein
LIVAGVVFSRAGIVLDMAKVKVAADEAVLTIAELVFESSEVISTVPVVLRDASDEIVVSVVSVFDVEVTDDEFDKSEVLVTVGKTVSEIADVMAPTLDVVLAVVGIVLDVIAKYSKKNQTRNPELILAATL